MGPYGAAGHSRAPHWVERHGQRSLSSISALLQNKGYIEALRPQRLTSSLWKAPERFKALHKALALCVCTFLWKENSRLL